MSSIPLKLASGERVGEITGDTAVLPVTSRNYLALAHGYSVSAEVLRTIIEAGCTWIKFRHVKTRRVSRISVEAFQANAKTYDFGFGVKLAAPASLYKVVEPAAPGRRNLYA